LAAFKSIKYPTQLNCGGRKNKLLSNICMTSTKGSHFFSFNIRTYPTSGVYVHNDLQHDGRGVVTKEMKTVAGFNDLSLICFYVENIESFLL
jgi:hypothetical protein